MNTTAGTTPAQAQAALESVLREGAAQPTAVAQAIADLVDAAVQAAEARTCARLKGIGSAIAQGADTSDRLGP